MVGMVGFSDSQNCWIIGLLDSQIVGQSSSWMLELSELSDYQNCWTVDLSEMSERLI